MTLKFFLFIVATLMVLLWFIPRNNSDKRIKWWCSKSPVLYFLTIVVALTASYWTFTRYAKSHDTLKYYKNTDYHILQQDGFSFPKGQTAWLASTQEDIAILNSDIGNLWIDSNVCMQTDTTFQLPLYVSRDTDNDENDKLVCDLVNNIKEFELKSGDEIMVTQKNDTLLKLQYVEIPREITTWKGKLRETAKKIKECGSYRKQYDFLFRFSVQGSATDSVTKKQLSKGYNLATLLQEGENTRLDPNLASLFNGCYLLRGSYTLDVNNRRGISQPLYLFANENFCQNYSVYVNGNKIRNRQENAVKGLDMNGRYFFYGLGATESPIYKVTSDKKQVSVKYRLPQMYHFPDLPLGETKIFLTTDIQDIIDHRSDFKCFYQFNEQSSENSLYKGNAVINLFIDSAGVSLKPEYANWYNGNTDGDINTPIEPDKTFDIKTLSCQDAHSSIAQVSYLFTIRDMRNNEVYKRSIRLYIILLLMLLVIYLMIHYLQKKGNSRIKMWYIIETSVYLVLIAFLTVRLILLWRLHTFPPIENTSYLEFKKLTDASMFTWTLWSIVIILAIRMIILGGQWLVWENPFYDKKNLQRFVIKPLSFVANMPDLWFKNFKSNPIDLKTASNFWEKARVSIKNFLHNKWAQVFLLPITVYIVCGISCTFSEKLCVVIKEGVAPILAFVINSMYFVYLNRNTKCENKGRLFSISFWKKNIRSTNFHCWTAILANTAIYLVFLFLPVIGFNEKGMLLPMMAVFALWFLLVVWFSNDQKRWKWTVSAGAVTLLLFIFLHVAVINTQTGKNIISKIHSGGQLKARIEALIYTPTEMVEKESVEFKGDDMQALLNASSNKWYIDNHLIQRERNREQLEAKDGDFLLDYEYNQLAVNHITQTRDLLLLRFIIYEHGKCVVNQLIFLLFLLLLNVFWFYKKRDDSLPYTQFTPLFSAIFLLVFSVYLYLVNMNAVVFVGLDFPFLTLTSMAAPMGLLFPLLSLLLPLNITKEDKHMFVEWDWNINKPETKSVVVCSIITVILMLCLVIPPMHRAKNQLNTYKNDEGRWDLPSFSVSMASVSDFVNLYLNPTFKDWQRTHTNIPKMKVNDSRLQDALQLFITGKQGDSQNVSQECVECPFEMQLKAYARDHKHSKDTTFIRSAFMKYFQTKLTDTDNLIFIRKQNGMFVFVVNKLFYDMKPIFKNDLSPDWEGDLLASSSASRIYFKGERNERILPKSDNLKIERSVNQYRNYLYQDEKLSCEIFQIPAKYCYKAKQDVFVLITSDESNGFTLRPKGDGTSSLMEMFGLVLLPNDIVQVTGARKEFSIRKENDHYFAKRIHYNGKHQVIYPLGDHFMFAYNFDQMLAQHYHPSDSATQPVRLSLDYDLFNKVYDYCEETMRRDRGYGDGIAVVAVDGNGRIRLMADYNPNKKEKINPNQSKKLQDRMNELYLSGDNATERGIMQNRNVSRMPYGPGSTIKIPFYVSLIKQVPLDWNNLGVQFPKGIMTTAKSTAGKIRDVVPRFGYDTVSGIHKLTANEKVVKGWDEYVGEYSIFEGSVLSASDFIATSNNFYYGTLLMLGAYDANKMQGTLNQVLQQSSATERVFPKVILNGNPYCFKRNLYEDITQQGYGTRTYALETGLINMFGFVTSSSLSSYDRRPVESLLGAGVCEGFASENATYVFSTIPKLYRNIAGQTNRKQFYDNHFNLTAGGASCLDVTPLNMAEMYLRIALMNDKEGSLLTYNDSISRSPQPRTAPSAEFSKQMRDAVYSGMHKVIFQRDGIHNGTLSGERVGQALQNELRSRGIYIYAKTGTAGVVSGNNNYHYAFILSNMDLRTAENRSDLKVYIIYFGYYNGDKGHSGTQQTRDIIIHEIINSDTFKNYWETNNNTNN